jgi:proteasome activator subunit 4
MIHLTEEAIHTEAYSLETPRLNDALRDLQAEFSPTFVNQQLLAQAQAKNFVRIQKRGVIYNETVSDDLRRISLDLTTLLVRSHRSSKLL